MIRPANVCLGLVKGGGGRIVPPLPGRSQDREIKFCNLDPAHFMACRRAARRIGIRKRMNVPGPVWVGMPIDNRDAGHDIS